MKLLTIKDKRHDFKWDMQPDYPIIPRLYFVDYVDVGFLRELAEKFQFPSLDDYANMPGIEEFRRR